MAECSESTGTISAPRLSAASITSSPAQTSVSLLARAMRLPSRMAARVGLRPTMPTTAVTTVSTPGSVAAVERAETPPWTRVFVSARRTFKSLAAASSVMITCRGRNFRACSSASATLLWAVMAATVSPSCSATSRVCRPMEPVEPKIDIVFVISTSLFYYRKLKIISNTGATNSTLSNRSSTPPWAKNRCP